MKIPDSDWSISVAARFVIGISDAGVFSIVSRSDIQDFGGEFLEFTKIIVNVGSNLSKQILGSDILAGISGNWGWLAAFAVGPIVDV